MEVRIYEPYTEAHPAFSRVGITRQAATLRRIERFYQPGQWEFSLPAGADYADRLQRDMLVCLDGSMWGLIDRVQFAANDAGQVLTVSGCDLKGLTGQRVTIPPAHNAITGAAGYDTATGSTETVMKHFIASNLCASADVLRNVYGLRIAADQGRGVAADKYMSRYEGLSDVLRQLGEAARLGYSILPDLTAGGYVFDCVKGLDRSAAQSDRPRILFSLDRRNVATVEHIADNSAAKNVFYTTMSGAEFADEALTMTYTRDGESLASGIYRREMHLELSADTPTAGDEYNELKRLALISAEDYRPAESFTCEVLPREGVVYGADYNLGDTVTVRSLERGVVMHAQVTGMDIACDAGGYHYTATFGRAPINYLKRLERKIR